MKVWPGTPYPLGAHHDGAGTNFSFSEVAHHVELCLFDAACQDNPGYALGAAARHRPRLLRRTA